ncbi:hypothetical protein CTI12_AA046660 [Artemisia annua]|uniref:RING-type domain-containing protein n=1 Tax=Artemisia annua TaxID=35608 RepID=A0A2U1QBY1_ARTAN|nr:hypothetical protein CTI12_AA046660 [Artemisia annua]
MSGRDDGDLYATDYATRKSKGSITYVLGLSVALLILILIVVYISYKCNRRISFRLPPDNNNDEHGQPVSVSNGLDEKVLMTFQTRVFSDIVADANGTGCSICLVDYKRVDVIRSLPECDHMFHRTCIDTWLKVNPTCPVCRNSRLVKP